MADSNVFNPVFGIPVNQAVGWTPSASLAGLPFYEAGTWTPVLTFTTPGDLAVVYSVQVGTWRRIGNRVWLHARFLTSTFTHTTATGDLRVTGSPFTVAANTLVYPGATNWQGLTKALYTQINAVGTTNSNVVTFYANGSAQSISTVKAADTTTGVQIFIEFDLAFDV